MNIYEVISKRRSVRKYLSMPIPKEVLARIWVAVQRAPSACNLQPWRFLAVQSPQMRLRLRGLLDDWVFTAPMMVVALGNPQVAWRRDGDSVHVMDVAIATEHLVLAATAEGLGTCWICSFDRHAAQIALGLEKTWEPVAVIPLGYPDETSLTSERKPIAEIIREI